AGGVDISLDTFELVGFAKTAALTTDDMRVYDRRADGFIPGEGCGFVVMKRLEDAVADGDYVYAVLHGWGISSDGKGGLTAPNAQGQARALQRAYERAGWNINDIDFIEGHGTGTAVGDKTELEGIALAMNKGKNTGSRAGSSKSMQLRRCGITSLKSLIGHTKAASGVGALIKTVIALNQRILPPLANCFEPSPIFADKATDLYPLLHGEVRLPQEILRAGISGMGFGGINSHLALASGDAPSPKLTPVIREQKLLADYQRTELFIFSAPTVEELLKRVRAAEGLARDICEGERLDLAAHLTTLYGHDTTTTCGPVRAAVTADSPDMLLGALAKIAHILSTSPPKAQQTLFDSRLGVCIGNDVQSHRVGFLFPGQGSQKINMGRQLVQRHNWAEEMVDEMEKALAWPEEKSLTDFIFRPLERALDESQVSSWQEQLKQTEIAQPALCLASMLRLEQLSRLGIKPDAVGGHSLGELTAFYAAGAYSGEELIRFAALRGQAMAPGQGPVRIHAGIHAGTMASLACSAVQAQAILDAGEGYAVVANKNSPSQTVISGEASCIQQACRHAEDQGIRGVLLPVANAFHSRFVSQAAKVLDESQILPAQPKQLTTTLFTSLQGRKVDLDCDLRRHFSEQVISPVDFISLVQEMSKECDLLLEVGPGRVLTGLARNILATRNEEESLPCFSLESEPEQDRDLNIFLAAYFVHGGTIDWHALYENRLIRPFMPVDERLFFDNPCERPFPEHLPEKKEQSPSLPNSLSLGQGGGEKTSRLLAEAAGISEENLSSYLEQRSRFLGGLIRVDLDNMTPSVSALESIFTPPLTALPESPELPGLPKKKTSSVDKKAELHTQTQTEIETEEKNSADLLFALIEERTGFPPESLSMDLRLLDDLNLDSIKASELIAEAANRAGVAAANLNV
ncbi:MAG: polyketide synthase, partial [Candidatus Electrothrix sp. GM3_4]|nr:polyketide synthase [Candidatus Electrothrix sp. GM3_4]